MGTRTVWIVQHDESPDNTVLGVFATQDEAADFIQQISDDFNGQLLYSEYAIGYKFNEGTRYAEYTIDD